jgi:uncharacterized membrane protein YdbT with pleckstrin-like domain
VLAILCGVANSPAFLAIFMMLAFFMLLVSFVKHIKRNSTTYTLTSEKLKIKTGILGKAENNVPLSKIQNVGSAYSLPQRILGIGNIVIESAGSKIGDIPLRDIEKPDEYVQKILTTVHEKESAVGQHHGNP